LAKNIKVTITGEKEFMAKFQRFADEFPKEVAASLKKQLEKTMIRSKRDFVPVDEGTLRDTGHVDDPEISKKNIKCRLRYGGPAAPYARDQHENLSYKHTVGEAKYLERPLKQDSKKILPAMAKDLKL